MGNSRQVLVLVLILSFYSCTFQPISGEVTKTHYFVKSTQEREKREDKPVMKMVDVQLPTKSEKENILLIHNDYRKLEEADNMEYMEWSDKLAQISAEWVSSCKWGHGQPLNWQTKYDVPKDWTYLGQNIAYYTDMSFTKDTFMIHTMNQFWIEKNYLDLNTMECQEGKQCYHYTQLVWADTRLVGCAVARCPRLLQEHGDGVYLDKEGWSVVCNYYPGGNGRDSSGKMKQPFTKTSGVCTRCTSGQAWCYQGLCRSKDSCLKDIATCECKAACKNCGQLDTSACTCECQPGTMGPDCSERCEDKHTDCGANPGWPRDWCTHDRPWMYEQCPRLCHVCAEGSSDSCSNPDEIQSAPGIVLNPGGSLPLGAVDTADANDSETQQQNPETQQQNSETQQQNSETQQQNSETQQQNSETQQQNSETQQQNSETQQQNSETQQQNTETQQHNSEAQQHNPETQQQNTETQQQNPEAQQQNPETQQQNPEAQQQNPETQQQNTETQQQQNTETQQQNFGTEQQNFENQMQNSENIENQSQNSDSQMQQNSGNEQQKNSQDQNDQNEHINVELKPSSEGSGTTTTVTYPENVPRLSPDDEFDEIRVKMVWQNQTTDQFMKTWESRLKQELVQHVNLYCNQHVVHCCGRAADSKRPDELLPYVFPDDVSLPTGYPREADGAVYVVFTMHGSHNNPLCAAAIQH